MKGERTMKNERRPVMRPLRIAWHAVGLCLLGLVCHTGYCAETSVLKISVDTTRMAGNSAGPFSIAIALTDGSGLAAGDTTVQVTDIGFSGGRALGGPVLFGGANGELGTAVTITNSSLLGLLVEPFSPGSELTFSLSLTAGSNKSGTPDRLTVFILDGSGAPIATLAPAGDYFVGIDLTSDDPSPETFGSDLSRRTFTGSPISIPRPKAED